jgi:hypothetical protein
MEDPYHYSHYANVGKLLIRFGPCNYYGTINAFDDMDIKKGYLEQKFEL